MSQSLCRSRGPGPRSFRPLAAKTFDFLKNGGDVAEVALFEDLDSVARDAAGKLDRAVRPSLFDRLDWYRRLAEHCPPPGKLLVARARAGERWAWLFLALRHPLAEGYAAEVSCFAAFAEFLHDPLTPEGQSALRVLRVAMEGVRQGRIAPREMAPAGA